MPDHCEHTDRVTSGSGRAVLWVALALNAGMFLDASEGADEQRGTS